MMIRLEIITVIFFLFLPLSAVSSQSSIPEYHVKASLIYNFINFTRWPKHSFSSENTPYTLCVVGEDPYSKIFASVSNRTVHGRRLQVKHLVSPILKDALNPCKILINRLKDNKESNNLLKKLSNLPILTINEMSNSKTPNVMINFVINQGRIGFTINRTLAKTTGIEFSSKMLRLAVKVT